MARMETSAGEMEVKLEQLGVNKEHLFISGQIGVWEAQIYFERGEVIDLVKRMLRPEVVKYILTLPFAFLTDKVKRHRHGKGRE